MTGRIIRDNKRDAMSTAQPRRYEYRTAPMLTRPGMDRKYWIESATSFERWYQSRFARRRKRAV